MALQPRNRRDTPAQDDRYRRQEQNRRSATSMARGRDTPAQDRNMQRQQTPAQGRTVARERIDREQSRADRIGQQGSVRERANSALGAARRFGAAGTMEPNPGPAISQREVEAQADSAGAIRGALRGVSDWLGSGQNPPVQPMRGSPQTGPTPAPVAPTRSPGATGSWGGEDRNVSRGTSGASGSWEASLDQSAMDTARNVGAGTGYAIGPDGRTQFVPGTQRSQGGISVTGDMGAANAELARANEIRQEMIDSQRPQNQVTTIGSAGAGNGGAIQGAGGGLDGQIQRLVRQAGNTRDPAQRAGINRQISQLQDLAGLQADRQAAQATNDTTLQAQQLRNQGAMATTLAGQTPDTPSGTDIYNMERAEYQRMQNEAARTGQSLEPPEPPDDSYLEALMNSGRQDLVDQELNRYQAQRDEWDFNTILQDLGATPQDAAESYMNGELDPESRLYEIMERQYGPADDVQSFAEGGLVQSPELNEGEMGPSAGAMSMAGAPAASGMALPDPVEQEYQDYAQGAQQIGVQAIPFEEFAQLKSQQAQVPQPPAAPTGGQPYGAMGFAQGGEIPDMSAMPGMGSPAPQMGDDPYDASGQLLMDPDPMAETDSIPAMIDGQHPAKLDSGEFVIPESVVRFHGLEKLNKLIAQAEENSNGTEQRTASASGQARSQNGSQSPA